MPHYHRLVLYFDGASRRNPRGPAGCGWVLREMDDHGTDHRQLAWGYQYLGHNVSCNQAEYSGLELGLDFLNDNCYSCHGLYIRGDSEIVINQLEGVYEVRSNNIIPYYNDVMQSIRGVDSNFIKYTHIPRSKNWQADRFANIAIDHEESENFEA